MRFLAALLPLMALAMVSLSPVVPTDVPGGLLGPELRETQKAVEAFAWDEFVALSWPARAGLRGIADANKPIHGEGLRVWETWKSPEEIFLPQGAPPLAWEAPLPRERCLTENLQAVQSDGTLPATLTDRHGRVVRYEVRVNKILFDHIRTQKLYDSRTQKGVESVRYPDGAMAVKASWRELEPGEESQFLTRECVVFETKNGRPGRKRRRMMGLVGLHIVHKTPSAPQWTWATFEHTGNTEGESASFCPPSVPESRLNRQTRPGQPNRVRRVQALSPQVQRLNRAQQQALHATGSVLQNYELVGVQWSTPEGGVTPTFLANTTMESFVPESSCLGCHAGASTLRADQYASSDYLYLLRRLSLRLGSPCAP
jgi:hypothetical protein